MAITGVTKDRVVDLTGGLVRVYCTITFSDGPPRTGLEVDVATTATDMEILAALRSKYRDTGTVVQPGPITLPTPPTPPVPDADDVAAQAWLVRFRRLLGTQRIVSATVLTKPEVDALLPANFYTSLHDDFLAMTTAAKLRVLDSL